MADAVTTNVIRSDKRRHIVHLTNISDGTGEAAVIKVDKSTLTAIDAAEPASLDIEAVRWSIQGMNSVRLLWDHTTDDVAMLLCNSGFEDFYGMGTPGDSSTDFRTSGALADPRSAGGTGDILLTTQGAVANGTYDITLWLRLDPD